MVAAAPTDAAAPAVAPPPAGAPATLPAGTAEWGGGGGAPGAVAVTAAADGGDGGGDDGAALAGGAPTAVAGGSPTESASDWSSSTESSGSAASGDSGGGRRVRRRRRRPRPLTLSALTAHPADATDVAALRDLEDLPAGPPRDAATFAALHDAAVRRGCDQYVDAPTGYRVWTALFLGRQPCCGNACRHCPYEHVNVPKRG